MLRFCVRPWIRPNPWNEREKVHTIYIMRTLSHITHFPPPNSQDSKRSSRRSLCFLWKTLRADITEGYARKVKQAFLLGGCLGDDSGGSSGLVGDVPLSHPINRLIAFDSWESSYNPSGLCELSLIRRHKSYPEFYLMWFYVVIDVVIWRCIWVWCFWFGNC